MELIKIMFFAIGTFFGIENSQIGAEKTTVTIDPNAKTITVIQENLFTMIRTKEDSLLVSEQLASIMSKTAAENPESPEEGSKSVSFYTTGTGNLNAKIEITYTNHKELKDYAIDLSEDGSYSLIHIPSWNLSTEDGTLKDNYRNFKGDTTFEFTLAPFNEIPAEYEMYKKNVLPMWEKLKD